MSSEEDARARREAWEAAGSPDYNVVNQPDYQPPAPSYNAPSAPTVSPSWYPGAGQPQKAGDPGWDQRNQRVTGLYYGPGDLRAPSAPNLRNSWYAPSSDGGGGIQGVPDILAAQGLSEKDRDELELKRAEMAEKERQNKVAEKLAQDKFDLDKAIADATKAYNDALLAYNDRRLAQEAFDNSIMAANESHKTMIAAQSQAATAQYQGMTIALQKQSQLADLRKMQPIRAPRITMV